MGTNITNINDWGTIQIKQFPNASQINKTVNWKGSKKIPYQKYSVKESDMRVKTATFTSPQYLDLTTGLYAIRILSRYHENFAGVVLDVDYNEDTGLYDYQCQDFSRFYISKTELICKNIPLWKIIVHLLTNGKIDFKKKKISRKGYQKILSGLRPLKMYKQGLYKGNIYGGNPFTSPVSIIARDKSRIEIIRDIVFSQLGYFDVYFNDRGVLQIEPISKTDWENTGLHLTNNEFSDRKFKFSTTNSITGVRVNGSDAKAGKSFWTGDVLNIDLSAFFGNIETSIANPIQSSASKKKSNATNKTTAKNTDNPYGTKNKVVYMNIDSIDGDSSDQNKMDKMCDILKKHGWECHTCGVGSESHYQRRGEVHGGIWFTLYGGACAGTLYETCTNKWYRSPLVDHGSRTVVGFFPPAGNIRKGGKYYEWLPRAHDDGFSSYNFSGISHMADMLTNCAVPFMYANSPSEMVAKFLKGGDNPEACTKNWKFYSR